MLSRIRGLRKDYNELKYLAFHDSLTGLLNRNWFYKNKSSISSKYVYFLDINDLHFINKKGHINGDEHIVSIVNSIKTDDKDIFIRYAGDEFIIFSDKKNLIKTNKFIAVGFAEIKNSISKAIHLADKNMLESKEKFKNSY